MCGWFLSQRTLQGVPVVYSACIQPHFMGNTCSGRDYASLTDMCFPACNDTSCAADYPFYLPPPYYYLA
jgi:hypothetical protein